MILIAVLLLGAVGAIGAIILFLVAQKFKVYEDPRIGQV
ncbi:MAG: ferredoxin, partial [Bacteroidales bacterium]